MTQEASVIRLLPDRMAEVSVLRRSACGGNCTGCDGCSFTEKELRVVARNCADAQPGQRVSIETKSAQIFRYAALVYILPVLALLAGYILAFALHLSEALCILAGFGLLVLCAVVLIAIYKKRKTVSITYEISAVLGD